MKVDLVFEGGGILGLAFVGAYEALVKSGYQIARSAGTSAGSIISALIMAGYSYEELASVIRKTDFSVFQKKTRLSHFGLFGKALSVIYNKGIYDIGIVQEWLQGLLLRKGVRTFKDLMTGGISPLKIIAADITDRQLLILPDDASYYGIEPEDFSVSLAVAMSCSIPLFFTPVKIAHGRVTNYIVDGGLLSTFPIWIFDVEKTPRYPTFGFKIKDPKSNTAQGKAGIIPYLKDLITASINTEETTYLRDADLVRTIIIDFDNKNKSTDFKITRTRINYLYECGYQSTIAFLKQWNFFEYVKKYRM
ncbi:MAG: patatin-like phospholipase family protein [Firmicutes bacterium]|jgi:NTE family protein|nr:patatin-like phospholipase family protein [Bacillota bacterium]